MSYSRLNILKILPSFKGKSPEPEIIDIVKMWDPNIHVTQHPIKIILLYILVDNSLIPIHLKARICYIEILTPHFGPGIFMNVRILWSPLVRQNSNIFKYCIRTDTYRTCLCCNHIAYVIKMFSANNNNKRGIISNMIRPSLTVKNNSWEYA